MTKSLAVVAALASVLAGPAYAGDPNADAHSGMSMSAEPETDGAIREINLAAGTITVEHGLVRNLGMGAMTMPYNVKDRSMLKAVKPGDKVKMTVEELNQAYTITALLRVR